MKQDTAVYYASGNISGLSKKLREKGFGVSYQWEEIINDIVITKRISPDLETLSGKIRKDGSIADSVITGYIMIDEGNEKKRVTKFKLEVYLNQPRGNDLKKFLDGYSPCRDAS